MSNILWLLEISTAPTASSEDSHPCWSLEERLKGFRRKTLSGLLHNYQTRNATWGDGGGNHCKNSETSLKNKMIMVSVRIISGTEFLVCSLLTSISPSLLVKLKTLATLRPFFFFFFGISQLFYNERFDVLKHYHQTEAHKLLG